MHDQNGSLKVKIKFSLNEFYGICSYGQDFLFMLSEHSLWKILDFTVQCKVM